MVEPELLAAAGDIASEALDLPAEEQRAFIAAACGDDPHLMSAVEGIVSADRAAGGFLARPVARLRSERPGMPGPGSVLGSYRLGHEIGRGGMGVVYAAERSDDAYSRRVAIKVLPPIHDPAAARRLLTERRALAALEHPNIAHLYDGGTAEDGSPYLVMEHVDGEPIDRWCDRNRLDVSRRIELFLEVAEAVAYAHRQLVVHRDLKPANILVTADGAVRLLDFGIARILEPDPGEDPAATHTTQRAWTPQAASPEQIRGGAIGTASDVYSLGVLLYRLLTGRSPYRPRGPSRHDLERAVLDDQPLAPSVAVSGDQEAAERRSSTASRLARRLAGDLDAILLTALAKKPDERYPDAREMARDLRRHLDARPIAARRPSRVERALQLARRHRVEVAAALLVFVVLSTATLVSARLAVEARRERDAAQRARVRTEAVSGFLEEILSASASDPAADQPTLWRLLEHGRERIDSLAHEPELEAAYATILGSIYRDLGRFDTAEALLRRAVEIRRERFGAASLETAESVNELATLHQELGHFAEADAAFRQVLAIREAALGDDHPDTAMARNNLGLALWREGRPEEAEPLLAAALAVARRTLAPDDPALATVTGNLGLVLQTTGDLDGALPLLREALEVTRNQLGDDHLGTAVAANNLATLLRRRGELDEAERLIRESLDIRRRALGPDHPAVATAIHNLGLVLADEGKLEEAAAELERAFEIRRDRLGKDHPATRASAFHRRRVAAQAASNLPPVAQPDPPAGAIETAPAERGLSPP